MKDQDYKSATLNLLHSLRFRNLNTSKLLKKDLEEKGAKWICDNKKPSDYDARESVDSAWAGWAD
jgi:hypothetical protein